MSRCRCWVSAISPWRDSGTGGYLRCSRQKPHSVFGARLEALRSTQAFSRLTAASLHQSFMLGLNRSPLTLPEETTQAIRAAPADVWPALAALAVAGTQIRFARPIIAQAAVTIPEAALRLHADPRSF